MCAGGLLRSYFEAGAAWRNLADDSVLAVALRTCMQCVCACIGNTRCCKSAHCAVCKSVRLEAACTAIGFPSGIIR